MVAVSKWTPDLVDRIRHLWVNEGRSGREIAVIIRYVLTPKAIQAGAWRRWGARGSASSLTHHACGVRRADAPKLPPIDAPSVPPPAPHAPRVPPSEHHIAGPRAVTILEMGAGQCKWWVGPNLSTDHQLFCGKPRVPGKPYCEHHQAISRPGGLRSQHR
jgi:hypothetical protein